MRQSFISSLADKINFIGNVEGRDVFDGKVDVIVTDGFTGNVILKVSDLRSALIQGKFLAKKGVEVKDAMTVAIHMDSPDPSVFPRLSYNAPAVMSPTAFKACHQERVPLWGKCQTDDGLPPARWVVSGSGSPTTPA